MKVLMINSVCGIRSTGRICTDLAVGLEKQGHEVKIAYGRENVPAEFERFAVKIGSDLDVKLHGIKARAFDAMGFGSVNATKEFIHWVREYDPDVIHLHNIHGYYINIELLFDYLRTCGKKIIWTLHDCWAFTGHSAYFDAIHCTRWKDGCHHCPQKSEYPKSLTDRSKRNWLKKKDIFTGVPNLTIITPSDWLKDLVEKSFLKEYPIIVVHNGVDTTVFNPVESDFRTNHGLEDKYLILGVAAVWEKRKGFDDFIELRQKLDQNYQIMMVGLTNKQKKLLLSGMIPIDIGDDPAKLAEIYSAADVFVNPTYEEVLGMVNLEAVACGTAVVTYNTGGSPEAVGDNGIVVQKGDIQKLTEAVKRVCESRENPCVPDSVFNKRDMIKQYSDAYSK